MNISLPNVLAPHLDAVLIRFGYGGPSEFMAAQVRRHAGLDPDPASPSRQ